MNAKKHLSLPDVLKQFTEILFVKDPIKLGPQTHSEYAGEALSILARFVETSLHVAESEEVALSAANAIVAQTFRFWFEELVPEDLVLDDISVELLHCLISACPTSDKSEALEVS